MDVLRHTLRYVYTRKYTFTYTLCGICWIQKRDTHKYTNTYTHLHTPSYIHTHKHTHLYIHISHTHTLTLRRTAYKRETLTSIPTHALTYIHIYKHSLLYTHILTLTLRCTGGCKRGTGASGGRADKQSRGTWEEGVVGRVLCVWEGDVGGEGAGGGDWRGSIGWKCSFSILCDVYVIHTHSIQCTS